MYVRSKRMLVKQSHNFVCVQLRKIRPVNSDRDGSVFTTRPYVSIDVRFTQERFWFVFALLMSSGDHFSCNLVLKTPFLRDGNIKWSECQWFTELTGFTKAAVEFYLGLRSQKKFWNAPDGEAHGSYLRNHPQSSQVCLWFHDRKGSRYT